MKKFFALLLVLVFVCGCGEGLKTMIKLDKEQKAQHKYVAMQSRKVQSLIKNIKNNKLKLGLTRKRVISIYGQPILAKEVLGYNRLLYRDALDFNPAEKAYLYFDQDDKLANFELVIREPEEEAQEEVQQDLPPEPAAEVSPE